MGKKGAEAASFLTPMARAMSYVQAIQSGAWDAETAQTFLAEAMASSTGGGKLLTKGQTPAIIGVNRSIGVSAFNGSVLTPGAYKFTQLNSVQGDDDAGTLYTLTGHHDHDSINDPSDAASRIVCKTRWAAGGGFADIYWDLGESQTLCIGGTSMASEAVAIAAPTVSVAAGRTTRLGFQVSENGRGTGTGAGGGQVRFTDAGTVGANGSSTQAVTFRIPPFAQSILVWRTVFTNAFQVLYIDDAGNPIGEIDVPASTNMPRTELQDGLRTIKITNTGAGQPAMVVYPLWGLGI